MENNAVQKKELSPLKSFNAVIQSEKTQDYLKTVLGKKKDSFVTSLLSAVANDANLQLCDPMSLMYTAMKATSMNLPIDPNLGYAAMIPYKDNKEGKTKAQFQIMRNGYVELLMRTGQVQFIANEPVHEGELVKANKFTGEYIFDEAAKKSDKIIGYMAYVKLTNGFEKTVYWTVDECLAHAKRYSQTFKKGYGVWAENQTAMCLKTVLKHLIVKYMPKSVELLDAVRFDQASVDENGNPEYIDGVDDQMQQEEYVADAKAALRERNEAAEADPGTGEIEAPVLL
jgi:recombination protein RecT